SYAVTTASQDGRSVQVAGGLHVQPDGGLSGLADAGTVIVPGYAGASATRLSPAVLVALRAADRRGARMVSICSGAFALAQANLLDGRTVTTHWSLCETLARQHPMVRVEPNALFIDNGQVLTSGGVTAGVDLCLHILRQDLGTSVSNHVARRILSAPNREGGQGQYAEPPPAPPGDDPLAAAQQWMLSNLAEPLSVEAMAAKASMSSRTFHRRFRETTSVTPLAWLHGQRIGRLKELLETTDLPVEELAAQVGLGSPANLRQHFRRATGLTPGRYRARFSRAEPAAA
ncbi:MAG: helix-turn-helix domain-containing protein, partial [Solirubrobacterales bacterium]|nr:helix-turn-helix domain-containing protein [Solirubrobacterales bacterium]